MFEINDDSDQYKLNAVLTMEYPKNHNITKSLSICIRNDNDFYFQGMKALVGDLKKMLCKNPTQCVGEEDLNDVANIFFVVEDGTGNKE